MNARWTTAPGLPMAFLIYAVGALLAAVPALFTDGLLAGAQLMPGLVAELLRARMPTAGRTLGIALAATTAITLLLAPGLIMAWLTALRGRSPVRVALRQGVRLYVPSLLITLTLLVPTALLVGVALLLPYGAHLALVGQPNPAFHDLTVCLLTAPALTVLLAAAALHDLARAALAAGARDPLARAFAALGLRVALRYVAFAALGALLAIAAAASAVAIGNETQAQAGLALVLGQAFALARVLCRGVWLGHALTHAEQRT